jgi:lipopolysaccharide/colanic/teichoic acid biosynthesis glycosyltransferase
MTPGLTGWAQLHAGYADSLSAAARKLSYDLWYMRHRTLFLDVAICAKTVLTVASGAGAH